MDGNLQYLVTRALTSNIEVGAADRELQKLLNAVPKNYCLHSWQAAPDGGFVVIFERTEPITDEQQFGLVA